MSSQTIAPALLLVASSLLAQQAPPPLYPDLGTHHKAVGTRVPLAQQYFDQGFRLVYGFNHAEAIRSFTRATELDPACAMCWWGIAYAYGPHVNAGMDSASGVKAYEAAQKARSLSLNASPWKQAYIGAVAARYAPVPPVNRANLDSAYARMTRAHTAGQPWRQRLTAIAAENRALFEAHPWAAAISTVRPPLGPGLIAKYEHELSALDGLGLDDVQMDDALTHLLIFVQAWARAAADARGNRESGMDDEQWWAAHAPLLEEVLDPAAYPLAARVGTAAGTAHGAAYDPEHAYQFGLQVVLDGLATQLPASDKL